MLVFGNGGQPGGAGHYGEVVKATMQLLQHLLLDPVDRLHRTCVELAITHESWTTVSDLLTLVSRGAGWVEDRGLSHSGVLTTSP